MSKQQIVIFTTTFIMSSTLSIDKSKLPPPAFLKQAYFYQCKVIGGTAPYIWKIVSGKLPTGLTLNTSGLISGTPTKTESQVVTISVTDSSV